MRELTLYRHPDGGVSIIKGTELGLVPFTVTYDENAPCRICGEPVVSASMGGTDVCPWCDCGRDRDGKQWGYRKLLEMGERARNSVKTHSPETQSVAKEK